MLIDTKKLSEIADTLKMLCMLVAAVFEIRILRTSQGTVSGYFDCPKVAVAAIEPYIGKNDIYVSLNPPDPALIERSRNILTPYAKKTTGDSEIARLNWLLVDIDPVRKSGTASTEEEKHSALTLAADIVKGLRKNFNFPAPVLCDSGNGYHLLYHLAMKNTSENVTVLKNLLAALDATYSTDAAKVDRVTFNPARITKLYGVLTVKGDNSPERPHRWSG